ncbi:MAG: asparagine synthase (glutamine-hydrolyzing) [Actinomycetota bacterium]
MCGITGWVSFHRDLTRHQVEVGAMTATMACRGPDAEGRWLGHHAALGHRRLAVIDIEGGTQPMSVDTHDGSVVLTYSGEVYNSTELRRELGTRGHHFETRCDTEVVLRGYLEWGEGIAERLNGMYAFALWDNRIDTLVLIRDRLGVKPLYFYPTDDGVLFGSEPKAIHANPLTERAIDLDGLRGLFSLTQQPGSSLWCGMREVPSGGVVSVDRTGLRERRYWTLQTLAHADDLPVTVAHVRALLADIVDRQLVSDVPLCTLLSGGLDSSVITALAAAKRGHGGQSVRSFAVDFVGREGDFVPDDFRATSDAPFALDVAAHVGSDHEAVILDHAELADPAVRRAVITARDSPLSLGDMDASLYLLFRAVRERSTVALSGESADEVFGGYRWFHQPEVRTERTFPWLGVFVSGERARLSGRFTSELTTALDLPEYIRDQYNSAVAEVDFLANESIEEKTMRVACYLHVTRFVRMLLERKDRLSMAVGLEVRVPFCDHRLVEYVYNTPWAFKTFDGREKSLLRAASADLLPRSVVDRVKVPYPVIPDPRYAAALVQQSRDLLAADNPVFELADRQWLEDTTRQDSTAMPIEVRNGMERILDLSVWLDIYRPELRW